MAASLIEVVPWEATDEFFALNDAGEVPVLRDGDAVVVDSGAITEYLDERYQDNTLYGRTLAQRNEARRLVAWFDVKFRREVTDLLWGEKLLRRLKRVGTPSSEALRWGHSNLKEHLGYIGYLYEQRRWLAGDDLTVADIAAAAHLSVLDYLGDVPWQTNEQARDWYARMKSRPSFRPLLADRLVGFKPPPHYDDPDF